MPINYEAAKTLIKGLVQKMKSFRGNWNQNDPEAKDYIKNRPFYEGETVLFEGNITTDQYACYNFDARLGMDSGEVYTITIDGISYNTGTSYYDDTDGGFGANISLDDDYWGYLHDRYIHLYRLGPNYSCHIKVSVERINKIDEKFIPDSVVQRISKAQTTADNAISDAATAKTTAETAQTTAETAQAAAETAQAAADSKMNKANPVGTGSFSMNRLEGSLVGDKSVAIGDGVVAENANVFTEGKYNLQISDKYIVKVEKGCETPAYGTGGTTARYAYGSSYSYDPNTGYFTITVEGKTHWSLIPKGTYFATNHSPGTKIYYYDYEGSKEVIGNNYVKYTNITKIHAVPCTVEIGKYAHIVGNGTSDTARSNAHTLDWDGVGWYQGGLQVGGNAQDDGAKNVLLEGDAIPVPVSATIGQTVVVKAVDENGKPTEWEAQALPEGVPAYTSDDEGKFLRIVNGVPTWVAVPNAEEATF